MGARRPRRAERWVVAAAALLGGLPAARGAALPARVAVKEGEFYFEPKLVEAPAGEVTLAVTNEGAIEHNFAVEAPGGKVLAALAVVAPGETAAVSATLTPGTYRLVCTLPGHSEAGMVATLTVK